MMLGILKLEFCFAASRVVGVKSRSVSSLQADCNQPQPVSGTRHNGTLAIYSPGDVLIFTCDTGYKANYNPPTITCIDISNGRSWNPPSVSCDLDVVSLVIAIVVALVGIIVFVLAIIWLRKRRAERDSRRIRKKRASSNKYGNYEPRGSTRDGNVNHGMTEIEMDSMGIPMGANGSTVSRNGTNGHGPNGLLWSPPSARGQVTKEEEFAVLQRSRKSSATSQSSRTDNMPTKTPSGVHLNPNIGDVEFGAQNASTYNFKDIGSAMNAMAPPTLIANSMEMSLPMPDSISPRSTDENEDTEDDFNGLYAAVDKSKKTNDNNSNGSVKVEAMIEDDGYSAVGSSGNFTAHEEAISDDPYSEVKRNDLDEEDDYAVVKRVEETPEDVPEENDFDGLYAKVQK
nr:uncharacterized protein LOC129280271 [Lytechinus pictus]